MHHAHPPGRPEAALPHIPVGPVLGGVPRQTGRTAGPWQLPCSPAACRRARVQVRAVLAEWNLQHHTHTAELLVSELVGNALIHADGPLHLTVEHRHTLRCRVEDCSRRLPLMRSAALDDENGRGLTLVHLMSDDWGVDHTSRGKAVWFELG
ncbi:ATP-binding protein [Streptomyces sp. NPDC004647]|uniref:ATP-binding protein n=1 Tax=Streptomyces sp. NPDC004647 TaxID=3154671 RepID=UPI0033A25DB4